MKSERIEDLGRVREKLESMQDEFHFMEIPQSKHTVNLFISRYCSEQALIELHDEIRRFNDDFHYLMNLATGYEDE